MATKRILWDVKVKASQLSSTKRSTSALWHLCQKCNNSSEEPLLWPAGELTGGSDLKSAAEPALTPEVIAGTQAEQRGRSVA